MEENTVVARREARKKRILLNSENRLKRIAGKDEGILNDSVHSNDIPLNGLNNSIDETRNGPICSLPTVQNDVFNTYCNSIDNNIGVDGSETLLKLLADPVTSNEVLSLEEETKSKPTYLELLLSARLHYVCIALLVRFLYYIECGFLFGEKLFVPLCIVELTDLLCFNFGEVKTSSPGVAGLLGAVLLLSGVPVSRVTAFKSGIIMLSKLGKDLSAYFVSFIVFHVLLEWPG